jgi:type IV secretory pathway VirB6-like protein
LHGVQSKAIAKMPSYIANQKGETLMKTALLRILAIATLATGLSAFAADKTKSNETAMAAANTQQEGCASAQKEKKQKKTKSQRSEQTDQEKEFDRTLMGYFG